MFCQYHANGVLPADGGMAQQTSWVMAAFEIAQDELGRLHAKQKLEAERRAKAEEMKNRGAAGSRGAVIRGRG